MMNKQANSYKITHNKRQNQKSIINSMMQTRRRQLITVMRTLQQISHITSQNINQLKQLKQNITRTLRNILITKNTNKTIYTILTTDNKNFLNDYLLNNLMMENFTSQQLQEEIQKQKMNQFKEWIKNPESFESYFSAKLTKQNLKQILTPKYDLLRMVYFLESFLQQTGFKYKGYNFKMHFIDSNFMNELLTKLGEMINLKKTKTIKQKIRILKLLQYNIPNQSEIKNINDYMHNFIKLYQSLNSPEPYTRFNADQQSMRNFNFSIDQTTVVLRNPQLNYQKTYIPVSYQSEFAFINDGEYIFNNQYRPNFLCWDEIIDVQRSINTMIGSEYMVSQEAQNCWEIQGQMVEINSYLRSDKKIFLRLRLNSVQFDKITMNILRTTTWQNFVNDRKESYYDINLQIVPDEGDNRQIYGFATQSSIQTVQQQSKIDQSIIQQQQTHLVLEDDVISLFLAADEKYFICWNETRNHLIKQVLIQKPVLSLLENFQFQTQLQVGIVLYTTVSQIEIFNPKK